MKQSAERLAPTRRIKVRTPSRSAGRWLSSFLAQQMLFLAGIQGVDMFGSDIWRDLGTSTVLIGGLISLAILVLFVVAYIKILHRAGYSGWWVLILVVPVVNVVMILVFAFKRWPVQEELDRYRHSATVGYHPGVAGGYQPGGYNPGGYPQN